MQCNAQTTDKICCIFHNSGTDTVTGQFALHLCYVEQLRVRQYAHFDTRNVKLGGLWGERNANNLAVYNRSACTPVSFYNSGRAPRPSKAQVLASDRGHWGLWSNIQNQKAIYSPWAIFMNRFDLNDMQSYRTCKCHSVAGITRTDRVTDATLSRDPQSHDSKQSPFDSQPRARPKKTCKKAVNPELLNT